MSARLFGSTAADRLARRLDYARATSGKVVIDYLAEAERMELAEVLVARANRTLTITTRDGSHTIRAVAGDWVDLLPIVVRPAGDVREDHNEGTDGFASSLRDHFAQGGETSRPRVLVTLTPQGNETQRSATDLAFDRSLLALDALADELFLRFGLSEDDPRRRVVAPFIVREERERQTRRESVRRLAAFLEKSSGDPSAAGRSLNVLGGFFPDWSPSWAASEGKKSRLERNAETFDAVERAFADPLSDPARVCSELFADRTVEELLKRGRSGFAHVDLADIERRPEQPSKHANTFDRSRIGVTGASHHEVRTGLDGKLVVVVASTGTIHFEVGLTHPKGKEYVHLVHWDENKSAARGVQFRVAEGGTLAEADVSAEAELAVYRVLVSAGPRSYKRTHDELWLVVYGQAAGLAVEVGCELDFQRQAWVQREPRATFDAKASVGADLVEHAERPTAPPRDEDPGDLEGDSIVARIVLPKSGVVTRVFWPDEQGDGGEAEEGQEVYPYLENAAYARMTAERRKRVCAALQSKPRYLEALTHLARHDEEWVARIAASVPVKVRRHKEEERALGRILFAPTTRALIKTAGVGETSWERVELDTGGDAALASLLEARVSLLSSLYERATRHHWTDSGGEGVPLSLMHVDLLPHAAAIEGYLASWTAAYDALTPTRTPFDVLLHEQLIALDVVEERAESGRLVSWTVLPSHPWLLSALLRFQKVVGADLAAMSTNARLKFGLHLAAQEVDQLAHPAPFDEWPLGASNEDLLFRSDAPPFHLRFLPERAYRERGRHSYLGRVVKNKIRRYLQMHRHLCTERRTLRIGFVNPGDAHHLLEGIRRFVLEEEKREGTRERIPSIEVLLFDSHGEVASDGHALDKLFADSLVSRSEEADLLLEKLSYLKRPGARCPESESDYVHICFYRGLVDEARLVPRDQLIAAGWDGAFDDGVLTTPLRQTRDEPGGALRTERGLWISDASTPLRGALVRWATLLRGRRQGLVDPELGLAWGAPLPRLDEVAAMYEHSDWVVHLDRAIGFELFEQFARERAPITVIEYSDQEEPETPGYDTITVTKYAKPYIDQLAKVLDYAGLPLHLDVEDERDCGHALIQDINHLSGSWAIDFILGNVSNQSWNNRLRGNVGAALVYRWLARVERQHLRERFGAEVVPLCMSLEELVRATPAAGLPTNDGLFRRFSNENVPANDTEEESYRTMCDDLLVLYLTPTEPGKRARIFGRIIEVKFGTQPEASEEKGIQQVRGTHDLLSRHLSGAADRRDAPFRHKQLSLLIKARLEQARTMGALSREEIERLNCHALSARLASGDYEVEYTLGAGGTHAMGDVFLLSTKKDGGGAEAVDIQLKSGVRVVRMSRPTLSWLAFHLEKQATLLGEPTDTVPDLGRYGSGIATGASNRVQVPSVPVGGTHPVIAPAVEPEEPVPTDVPVTQPVGPVEAAVRVPEARLADAVLVKVKAPPYPKSAVTAIVDRLSRALQGHKIRLEAAPSVEEAELGPRLVRVHVRLTPGEKIESVRRISEDLARDVGTESADIHVTNVPERHAIGIDLPVAGLSYGVDFDELVAHPSFTAAAQELELGFCAGIDVTGRAVWTDLAQMPHALIAGTTGSGKTVFLRQLLLTLLLTHDSSSLDIRLSSSKPMDFMPFAQAPHARGRPIADGWEAAAVLVRELVTEMDRRIGVISAGACDNLAEYNREVGGGGRLPYLVALIDEYSETVLSIEDKAHRTEFERGVARLAQKSRAAGIHMVLCMQRPDSAVLQGPIKSNILHRFALKLPQQHDSRVILDENGAEALLGRGDMLYKDGDGRLLRLQVPNLEKHTLKTRLSQLR